MNGPAVNRAPDLHTHTTLMGLALQMLKKKKKREEEEEERQGGGEERGRRGRKRREIEMN